ncbi:MAG: 30S ribosomal protein S1 [Clostridium sp.]|nr:30S ribosomal protein S1 [Clostridium sp.]
MDNQNFEDTMGNLLKDFDVKRIRTGDILDGEVIDVNDKEVMVNINYAFDGVIEKSELTNIDKDPREVVNKGDKLKVYVLSPNDGEGYVQLSRVRALEITEREDIKKAFENNETIKVYVKEEVKGGVVAYYGNIRVFIPASLVSRERVNLASFIGKELEVKIIELDFKARKIVASRKVIEEAIFENNKKELWKSIKAGEKRAGVVKKLIKAGAIVDIGGITGLIHLTDLAWGRVNKAEDIVKEGDKVEVFVGEVDVKNERVSLILKDINKDPWTINNLNMGDVLEGKVVKFLKFGAFVELFPGVEGLVHINEITDENIAKPSDILTIGQKVKVKVLEVDKENKKVSLTIKDAEEKSKEYLKYNDNDEGVSLGDLFKGLF